MRFACRLPGWLLGTALLVSPAAAEELATPKESAAAVADDEVRTLPGVFNTELPALLRPESLRITLRPRFGDFVNHDSFRLTLGVRYGLTPRLELATDADFYVAHGLGDATFGEELGVSRIRLGAKYKFETFLQPYWTTAAGLNYSFPVGNPPADLSDGLHHLTPYMTLAHKWESRPEVTTFVSYGVALITSSNVIEVFDGGELDTEHWFVTPGLVWHRGEIDYSLETRLKSSVGLDADDTYHVSVRPGVKWNIPQRYTFNSRIRWTVGVGVHFGYGSDGADYGTSVRLQTDYDIKRFLRKITKPMIDAAR